MDWLRNHYVKKAYTFLTQSGIPIRGAWIDCGCGRGYYSKALHVLGASPVIAFDVRVKPLNFPIFVCKGDCSNLPVKNCSVSGFLYANVLHYYRKPQSLLQEAHRVLNLNGYIVIVEYDQVTPTGWDPYPLTASQIETLLSRTHFGIVKKMLVDTAYRPKHLIVGKKAVNP